MNFISDIIWNSVEGFVEAGTRTAGGYAGDALIKAGDMIEDSGRNVGTVIERRASDYAAKLSGQAPAPSGKALPSTARKPAIKRSNSSPASTKAGTTLAKNTSKTPIGANKYPGGKQVGGAAKQITSGVTGAKSTATKSIGGATSTVKSLPKAYPNNVPYGSKTSPQDVKSRTSNLTNAKSVAESKADNLPKPYPGTSTYPGAGKKTAVKPGQRSTFTANQKKGEAKPYPGTNTLPGQGKKVPVQAQKYKPTEGMKPQVEKGKMQHIAV